MIRKLLATTAIATLVSTGAFAQTATTTTEPAQAPAATETAPAVQAPEGMAVDQSQVSSEGQLASNLIGENVYNSTADDAEKVGDVNDLVLSPEGQIEAIVIGVGGFLGIGEKDVAIEYKTIDWAERNGDRWIVIAATEDELKALPSFDRGAYAPAAVASTQQPANAPATDMTANNNAANAPADNTAQAPATGTANDSAMTNNNAANAPAETTAQAPAAPATQAAPEQNAQAPAATDRTETAAIDRSTLKELNTAELRTEDFVGTTVYGANEENVGEIGDVILSQDGKVDAVIIDVGGFLGMGEKEVAVGMDKLSFMSDEDGERYLYTNFTKEQLEAAPAYDEANYAANRDSMRLVVPN